MNVNERYKEYLKTFDEELAMCHDMSDSSRVSKEDKEDICFMLAFNDLMDELFNKKEVK